MGPLGIPELIIVLVSFAFALIPLVVAVWALVTLVQIRRTQDDIQSRLERIERRMHDTRPA